MNAGIAETFRPIEFSLPPELEAHDPPEAWGRARDAVRMMVTYRHDRRLVHAHFADLPRFLEEGDLLVINNSRTLPASVPAQRADGTRLDLHLSTPTDGSSVVWVVELRTTPEAGGRSFRDLTPGERLELPEGSAEILGAYQCPSTLRGEGKGGRCPSRLWTAELRLPVPIGTYLERYGHPIRYGKTGHEWPISYYQNIYALEPGSVEMPSAGRPFTPEMITTLITRGIGVAPITLHAGVASLEDHEPPMAEFYRVPEETARQVNATRQMGARVIAIGTTVVRALETVADANGLLHAGAGWTTLIIAPEHQVRAVDGLLTGWHEPRASHLMMLEAIAGRDVLEVSYRAALEARYQWHEFGDVHLILP